MIIPEYVRADEILDSPQRTDIASRVKEQMRRDGTMKRLDEYIHREMKDFCDLMHQPVCGCDSCSRMS
ncbi:MAG: hypothetical protein KKF56_03825 [Nanoarchaeota archaeon]|nr:hypothetical protein [Nanoarchaeota archaeon]